MRGSAMCGTMIQLSVKFFESAARQKVTASLSKSGSEAVAKTQHDFTAD